MAFISSRIKRFQKMVKAQARKELGLNDIPQQIKPRVRTKAERKALNQIKIHAGPVALMSLRQPVKETSIPKAQLVLGENATLGFSESAMSKVPSSGYELKSRLFAAARKVGNQRRATTRLSQVESQIKVLSKMKQHFVAVATADNLFKLSKMSLPKVDAAAVRILAKENPSLKPVARLLDTEIAIGRTEAEQALLFREAPKRGKVVAKRNGAIIIEETTRTGVRRKIYFNSFLGIKRETKRRAYVVSRALGALRKEMVQAKEQAKSVNPKEVVEEAKPLIQGYRALGRGEQTALREVYEHYAGKEQAKRAAELMQRKKERVGKLSGAITSMEMIAQPYGQIARAKTFAEAIQVMNNGGSQLISVIQHTYANALETIPQLKKLRDLESIQLLLPESEAEVRQRIIASGANPKKVMGKAIVVNEGGVPYVLPTTIHVMRALAEARVKLIQESLAELKKQRAEEEKVQ